MNPEEHIYEYKRCILNIMLFRLRAFALYGSCCLFNLGLLMYSLLEVDEDKWLAVAATVLCGTWAGYMAFHKYRMLSRLLRPTWLPINFHVDWNMSSTEGEPK